MHWTAMQRPSRWNKGQYEGGAVDMAMHVEKLVSIGGNSIVASPPIFGARTLTMAGKHFPELSSMLHGKNGFYAFEAALHVFSAVDVLGTMDIEEWNSETLWRRDYGDLVTNHLFFAEDIFGGQYCIHGDKICFFDPETGETESVCDTLDLWAKSILEDYNYRTGFPLAHEWQSRHGALPSGSRLLPKVPFVCGGKFSVENLYLLDSVKGMRFRATLARQIKNLPNGAKIEFKLVE